MTQVRANVVLLLLDRIAESSCRGVVLFCLLIELSVGVPLSLKADVEESFVCVKVKVN